MLEFTMTFNDGDKVECLATTNPRVVELTATLSDATRTGINECDYCVILNNKPLPCSGTPRWPSGKRGTR